MDIKQLEYFLKVYEEGSFSKAAGALFITQQGLNKSIQKLEKELGRPLFVRTPHGLIPTAEGERLRKQAEPYLLQWSDILQYVQRPDASMEHVLRIGFEAGMTAVSNPDFFPRYLKRHPEEDIRLINTIGSCQELFRNNQVDIAFCEPPVDRDFFMDLVAIYKPVVLAVNVENPLAQRETVRISDLRDQRVIDFKIDSPAQVYYRDYCRKEGITPSIILNGFQGMHMVSFVAQNAAVSFFAGDPGWVPDNVRLIPFADMHIRTGFHIIAQKGRYISRLTRNFITEFCEEVGGQIMLPPELFAED